MVSKCLPISMHCLQIKGQGGGAFHCPQTRLNAFHYKRFEGRTDLRSHCANLSHNRSPGTKQGGGPSVLTNLYRLVSAPFPGESCPEQAEAQEYRSSRLGHLIDVERDGGVAESDRVL